MTLSRARMAKLEAKRNPRRGVLTLREQDGEPITFASYQEPQRRWTQLPGETFAGLIERIERDAAVARLILCTDRELPGATVLRRSYGTTVQRFSHRQFMSDLFRRPDAPVVPLPGAAP